MLRPYRATLSEEASGDVLLREVKARRMDSEIVHEKIGVSTRAGATLFAMEINLQA